MPQFYNRHVVRWLRDDWNINVIRASMAIHHGGFLEDPLNERRKIETVIEAALECGIYVIVDWHAHIMELPAAKQFFLDLARKYHRFPNLIYEPWNEPGTKYDWVRDIRPYHESIVRAVRDQDPHRLFVAGTENFSQRVDRASVDPVRDENTAYTLHFYAASHRAKLRQRVSEALSKGISLVVTEYGTCEATGDGRFDRAEMAVWWQFLRDRHLSHINWSIADKAETAAALKPGAAPTGGWKDSDLTPSGRLVRDYLRQG